ncbi:allergenic cerato-platanin Asp F13 [Talaromyces stipitatus ATCC 10500]|uniref:Allergenic cerato-platanin Asp F13 n=1 Tax=Talaromyces stipitatus (strain ATCC 10500 / CBS 375.48 / QM 6759 / NRRL 1006) TaxID=441959 RepID=B8MU47_TALSN|nr:allergenic cerato-platanin Asp F13 [Talaromyces stipitatus ATCC 10500]EED12680.1 allergenic cerato-platanin Asp F13 [Talaromyces stipitatus ATCC 10500]
MKITTFHAALFTLSASGALAANTTETTLATFDTAYDDANLSLSTVTCSNGENGLVTKGYNTISDLPTQDVAGSLTVKGWNDVNCGACYSLSYKNETVYVLAIDSAIGQFNVAQKVLDKLTHGQAQEFGSVSVDYEQSA